MLGMQCLWLTHKGSVWWPSSPLWCSQITEPFSLCLSLPHACWQTPAQMSCELFSTAASSLLRYNKAEDVEAVGHQMSYSQCLPCQPWGPVAPSVSITCSLHKRGQLSLRSPMEMYLYFLIDVLFGVMFLWLQEKVSTSKSFSSELQHRGQTEAVFTLVWCWASNSEMFTFCFFHSNWQLLRRRHRWHTRLLRRGNKC